MGGKTFFSMNIFSMNEGSEFESSQIHFSASQPALGYALLWWVLNSDAQHIC